MIWSENCNFHSKGKFFFRKFSSPSLCFFFCRLWWMFWNIQVITTHSVLRYCSGSGVMFAFCFLIWMAGINQFIHTCCCCCPEPNFLFEYFTPLLKCWNNLLWCRHYIGGVCVGGISFFFSLRTHEHELCITTPTPAAGIPLTILRDNQCSGHFPSFVPVRARVYNLDS